MLQLTLQKMFKKLHMSKGNKYLMTNQKRRIKKTSMTTHKMFWTPTTKEPKINHALTASSAFNLKLCHMAFKTNHLVKFFLTHSIYCGPQLFLQILKVHGQGFHILENNWRSKVN